MSKEIRFEINAKVVYPSHGVGEVIDIETQEIAGTKLEVYVISFPNDQMTLRVPVSKSVASGLRSLSSKNIMTKIYDILNDKPQPGNRMWSRRAQDLETKINSGNIELLCEALRDLNRSTESDRSYSERRLRGLALARLVDEVSIINDITRQEALDDLNQVLRARLAA